MGDENRRAYEVHLKEFFGSELAEKAKKVALGMEEKIEKRWIDALGP